MSFIFFTEEDLPDISFTRTDIRARDDDYCNVEFKASVSYFTIGTQSIYTLTLIVIVCKADLKGGYHGKNGFPY